VTKEFFVKAMVQEFQYGEHRVVLETGVIARQATAAVMASMDDTTVLVTVVGEKQAKTGQKFLPLTVHYQERAYAAGRIPGSFFRREGRPGEGEVLTSRLIDRPLRPLFPKGFYHEVQVVATVLSVNPQINPDIISMIGASAALALSGIPFKGPIGAARVGFIDGQYVLNPSLMALKNSGLDLVVVGTQQAVLMVESEADQLTESQMLGALLFGHQQQQVVIENIKQLANAAGKPRWTWQAPVVDHTLQQQITEVAETALGDAYRLVEKTERQQRLAEIKTEVVATLQAQATRDSMVAIPEKEVVLELLGDLEKQIVRSRLLAGEPRIDQRDPQTVRALAMSVGILPRTHGSALFTRGETQALVAATLGTDRDAQTMDELLGERTDPLLVHYNFPHYAVGETGMMGSPKRREIGHGRLAKRGLAAVMPSQEEFPYTVRVVAEITESNGSSSMATVCGASLALMDAGVPLKAAVAGIAMGLIKAQDQCLILSDILGDEDHLGDMDFKVAGTTQGITALQMDMKVDGIDHATLQAALRQAKGARLHILQVMSQAIAAPRCKISDWAPRIHTIKIDPSKIRDIIGKGGAVIRGLIEETGASIDVKDDGTVKIAANNGQAIQQAMTRIGELTAEIEKGAVYSGKVTRLADFGAFVMLAGGKEGLVHISQLSQQRVEKVTDCISEGEQVQVKVLEVDRQGRLRLSIKEVFSTDSLQSASAAPLLTDDEDSTVCSDEETILRPRYRDKA
jgi:polyribonucleotide nucleotidyltransferase